MSTRAQHYSSPAAYDRYYVDQPYEPEPYLPDGILPGERIGRPLPSRVGRVVRRGIMLLIVLGAGWACVNGYVTWPAWLPNDMGAVLSAISQRMPGPAAAPPRTVEPLPSLDMEQLKKSATADPPPPSSQPFSKDMPAAKPAPAPLTTASLPPSDKRADDAATGPLPPPTADPADPYQVRALAVGLHPDISRAVLARLSAADFRNAGIAIKTALAETADNAVFVWPRQRKPEEALFKVRFVQGAAAGCRRYVVTVTKDGWLTTALPMEKCGPQPVHARRG